MHVSPSGARSHQSSALFRKKNRVGFGMPFVCATIFSFFSNFRENTFARNPPTRCASHARPVGRAVPYGNALCHLAWLRRTRLCSHLDGLRVLLFGDAAFRGA